MGGHFDFPPSSRKRGGAPPRPQAAPPGHCGAPDTTQSRPPYPGRGMDGPPLPAAARLLIRPPLAGATHAVAARPWGGLAAGGGRVGGGPRRTLDAHVTWKGR